MKSVARGSLRALTVMVAAGALTLPGVDAWGASPGPRTGAVLIQGAGVEAPAAELAARSAMARWGLTVVDTESVHAALLVTSFEPDRTLDDGDAALLRSTLGVTRLLVIQKLLAPRGSVIVVVVADLHGVDRRLRDVGDGNIASATAMAISELTPPGDPAAWMSRPVRGGLVPPKEPDFFEVVEPEPGVMRHRGIAFAASSVFVSAYVVTMVFGLAVSMGYDTDLGAPVTLAALVPVLGAPLMQYAYGRAFTEEADRWGYFHYPTPSGIAPAAIGLGIVQGLGLGAVMLWAVTAKRKPGILDEGRAARRPLRFSVLPGPVGSGGAGLHVGLHGW